MTSPELETDCDITIFVACFNEERGIVPTLETVLAALHEVGRTYDVVVIDDCSTDRSVEIVREFMASRPHEPITLYVNAVNQGLGTNFVEGAFRGRGRYYRLVCGDDVESRETLVRSFSRIGEADMILTYVEGRGGRSWFRRLVSRTFTMLVNLLSGHRLKYYNGVGIHLRYNVMRWHSNSHGFGFQADLITRLLDMHATYVEVPVRQQEREAGASKAFTFKNLCSVAHSLAEIAIRRVGVLLYPRTFRKPVSRVHVFRALDVREQVGSTMAEVATPDPAEAKEHA